MDKYKQIELAIRIAKADICKLKNYSDLAGFEVMIYTDDELKELGEESGDWVGQYVKGSVDDPRGCTILINIDKHADLGEMRDTLCHEVGHALWELIDENARSVWLEMYLGNTTSNKVLTQRDAEEEFADHFMYAVLGASHLMDFPRLFKEITKK